VSVNWDPNAVGSARRPQGKCALSRRTKSLRWSFLSRVAFIYILVLEFLSGNQSALLRQYGTTEDTSDQSKTLIPANKITGPVSLKCVSTGRKTEDSDESETVESMMEQDSKRRRSCSGNNHSLSAPNREAPLQLS
jgi:hypothetical protein